MKNRFAPLLSTMILITPSLVQAHTHKTVMGTVKAVDATHIELTLKDGKSLSIPLAKSTVYLRGKDKVGADQVKPGIRVVITLAEDDTTAETVKLGKAPAQK